MRFAAAFSFAGGFNMKQTKYIFVTGGVVSGLGKGITAASLGRLLRPAAIPPLPPTMVHGII